MAGRIESERVSKMKERPILFSAPMVLAILEGRKTQTRRITRRQPFEDCGEIVCSNYHPTIIDRHGEEAPGDETYGAYSLCGDWACKSPYGKPGDRLWVKETWQETDMPDGTPIIAYRAGGYQFIGAKESGEHFLIGTDESRNKEYVAHKWKPSIFMPKWASRVQLEITGVRLERLQKLTRGDAMNEGCPFPNINRLDPLEWYRTLWGEINGAESWAANPWVWVIDFRRVAR